MREFKFRAWDIKTKTMHDVWRMGRLNGGWVTYNNGVQNYNYINKDCYVMQYAELKDKNGKEIYEGDILEVGQDDAKKKCNCKVVFVSGSYGIIASWSGCFISFDNYIGNEMPSCFRVIGNIYENPELLEQAE